MEMKKIAFKHSAIKIFIVVFLCLSVFILSAFIFPKESKYLTRYDLAVLMEKLLDDISIDRQSVLPDFSDISSEQQMAIKKILFFKIMNGFSDNTFRPNVLVHNLEVVSYLQRLTEFLRNNSPESYAAKQLFRFLSYNDDPSIAFEYSPLNFSKEFENPNKLTLKSLAYELEEKLIQCSKSSDFDLSGFIIDSITSKPVANAYISVNNQALAVSRNGSFNFKLDDNTQIVDIFAVAEGYKQFEIRKDLDLSRNIVIRLKPLSTKSK